MTNIQAVEAAWLSKSEYDTRYVIIDTETGEILDDAQGYGYKPHKKHIKHMLTKIEISLKIPKSKRKFKL